MLIVFIRALLYVWLLKGRASDRSVVEETTRFFYWLLELKAVVYLPESSRVAFAHKHKQIGKHVRKLPQLSASFYKLVDRLDQDIPLHMPGINRDFILAKRGKLAPLRDWFLTYDSTRIDSLKKLVLEHQNQAGATFKIKRNRRLK